MEYLKLLNAFGFVPLIAILLTACENDLIVTETVLPPAGESYMDCSYNFTTMVIDTNALITPNFNGSPIGYEGYRVVDICFNPNDPNELVVAMAVTVDMPQITTPTSPSILMVMDLCSGEERVIYQNNTEFIPSVDWGDNGLILFFGGSTDVLSGNVYHIRPDGTDMTLILSLSSLADVRDILWCPGNESILITNSQVFGGSGSRQFSLDGSLLNDLGFISAGGLRYMPDGKLAYKQHDVGIFDPADGTTVIIDPTATFGGSPPGIAYSAVNNGLLWSSDSMVAITNIQSGQRTELSYGYSLGFRRLYSASASKNGYLAYVAYLVSPGLSNIDYPNYDRTEIRLINPDGTDERRLVLDFE